MNGKPDVVADVVILGGGIAGLWLLDSLKAAGYSAVLLEAGELGSGQTIASQGIIHGGTKYTLGLALDSAVRELRGVPAVWRASLRGEAGPDLRPVTVLSERTCMWLPRQFGGRILDLFSRLMMRSRVRKLPRSDWPQPLRAAGARGVVLALDEFVLDMPSLAAAFPMAHGDRIRRIPEADTIRFHEGGGLIEAGPITLRAQRVVFAAGAGNEALMARAGIEGVPCQRRPLHQVMIRGMSQPLYAHCIGKRTRPLATVTSHPALGGGYIWYVGGLIAEDGVMENKEQLIARSRRELPLLFPGADFSAATWATVWVDRAEGGSAGGRRPGGPTVRTSGKFVVAWPTKLALAPRLAQRIVQTIRDQGVRPAASDVDALRVLEEPAIARPPWEEVERWS